MRRALRFLSVKALQVLCIGLEVVTLILVLPLGPLQVLLAVRAGERSWGRLGRALVNGRATSIGQLLGLLGAGRLPTLLRIRLSSSRFCSKFGVRRVRSRCCRRWPSN